ncbi:Xenobiotic-transporting ATPase [Syntrophobotulus glycolicus DSM 8271]|uniref:Xenobiotic-transporting ATPase n=1 Tax=Syntrophobotulus glycolicus (strain DSM 8271 / FlGlyR) TaxID=645991 RepID=F0T0F3_SYNGF|nr:ABC transporter ATP-binding protein [Syntrophobotulus glycolicus]ADY57325.1 Xenobiotic-transporting ATPase [Syntrophobotulus glycolicus DSM 8271]
MLKLYKLLKPYTLYIVVSLVLIFLQTTSDLYLPTLMADIVNSGVMKGDTDFILKTGGIMLLIAAGGAVCAVISTFLSAKASVGLGRIIRDKVFARVEGFSLHEFDRIGTATLITRTTNDITQIQQVTFMIMRMMVSSPLMAIGGILLAYSKDKALTGVLGIALPVLALTIFLVARKAMPLFKAVQVKIDKVNLVLREKLTGIRVIRAFNRMEHEGARFAEASLDLTNNYIKVNRIMAFLMPTLMLIMNLTTIAILWYGSIRIDQGRMDLGALVAFTQYAMQIMFSMLMFSMMFIMVPRAQASAARINEILNSRPDIEDPRQPKTVRELRGLVEFKNVTFSYHGAEQPALNDISFTAKPGEVTAIIGGTGSGKSSLVNLIPRFYDVDSGSVLVDGLDVREISQGELREKIGLVPQKAVLFSGTIADNIRYGKPDASGEEIREAAEVARAAGFIAEMKDGFETLIAQGGTNLSGGQKQRLSIARALVRRPEIYIFDDSFSALDFKTDAELREALKKETLQSTVLIVAQRIGTVMDADQIIVLDNGSIAGTGTHQDLLTSCEVYREIVSSQLSGEEIA